MNIELIISIVSLIIAISAFIFSLSRERKTKPRLAISYSRLSFKDSSHSELLLTLKNLSERSLESINISTLTETTEFHGPAHTWGGESLDWKEETFQLIHPFRGRIKRGFRGESKFIPLGICFEDFFYSVQHNEKFAYPVNICIVARGKDMYEQRLSIYLENGKKIKLSRFDKRF